MGAPRMLLQTDDLEAAFSPLSEVTITEDVFHIDAQGQVTRPALQGQVTRPALQGQVTRPALVTETLLRETMRSHKNPFEPQERPTLNSEKHFPKKPKAQKNNRNLKPQKDTQNLKPQKNNQNLKP